MASNYMNGSVSLEASMAGLSINPFLANSDLHAHIGSPMDVSTPAYAPANGGSPMDCSTPGAKIGPSAPSPMDILGASSPEVRGAMDVDGEDGGDGRGSDNGSADDSGSANGDDGADGADGSDGSDRDDDSMDTDEEEPSDGEGDTDSSDSTVRPASLATSDSSYEDADTTTAAAVQDAVSTARAVTGAAPKAQEKAGKCTHHSNHAGVKTSDQPTSVVVNVFNCCIGCAGHGKADGGKGK